MKKNTLATVRDVLKEPLSLYDSMHSLPKFHSAKLFVLLDKLSNMVTGLASGMVFTIDAVFAYFPGAQLDLALKQSKEFKNWHRSTEDLIDEVTEKLKDKLTELAECFNINQKNFGDGRPHDFVLQSLADMYTETAGRDPKRTAESLADLSKIIESSAFLEFGDFESRSIIAKSTRAIGDDYKNTKSMGSNIHKSSYADSRTGIGRRLPDPTFDRDEPVKEGGKSRNDEDDQIIKNVRITKGVIGSHSRHLFS